MYVDVDNGYACCLCELTTFILSPYGEHKTMTTHVKNKENCTSSMERTIMVYYTILSF